MYNCFAVLSHTVNTELENVLGREINRLRNLVFLGKSIRVNKGAV
jgi:hypothetical protein